MLPSKKKIFTGWFCSAQTFQIVIQVKSRDKLLTIVWLGNSLCSFLHRSLHHWIVMFIFVSLIVGFTRLYIYYRLYTIDYILHTIYYILYTIYHILYGDGSLDLWHYHMTGDQHRHIVTPHHLFGLLEKILALPEIGRVFFGISSHRMGDDDPPKWSTYLLTRARMGKDGKSHWFFMVNGCALFLSPLRRGLSHLWMDYI